MSQLHLILDDIRQYIYSSQKNDKKRQLLFNATLEELNKCAIRDNLIQDCLNKKISICDLIRDCKELTDPANPRYRMVKYFHDILLKNNPPFNIIVFSELLEDSCFRSTIQLCKQLETMPSRDWDCIEFVDIYSTRCGTILRLLNPNSMSCKQYGNVLINKIISKEILPSEVGFLSEIDICPEATQKEREEIYRRSEQKVTEKESNLFICPHCKTRKCTYREVQRRSLDEAPDYDCFCLNCKHRFTGRH